jgi:hypothetical protein
MWVIAGFGLKRITILKKGPEPFWNPIPYAGEAPPASLGLRFKCSMRAVQSYPYR